MEKQLNREKFANQMSRYSQLDRIECMCLLAIQIPLDLVDLKDIVDILAETRDKIKANLAPTIEIN